MKQEIETYKNSLIDEACQPKSIIRVSFCDYKDDTDLVYEGQVDPFIIDRNKILCSKAFRCESDKTQVFTNPDSPYIRTRAIHTSEVVATSNYISNVLGLNSHLTDAQSYGHDLGHGPFGHLFEQVSQDLGVPFRHERFSGIIATQIERKGNGLNLTKETLRGILDHSRGTGELTTSKGPNENLVVMYSDKISYIFSDINDLQRLGWISQKDLKTIDTLFPGNQRERVNQCIFALIKESAEKGKVSFADSPEAQNFISIKNLMYEYYRKQNHKDLAETIKIVYDCVDHIQQLQKYDPTLLLALMTDRELFKLGSVASCRRVKLEDLKTFGVFETIENGCLEGKNYQYLNSRLE